MLRPRCPDCGCWLTPICDGEDTTCSNERCESSWQACKAAFESSLLGAAVRDLSRLEDDMLTIADALAEPDGVGGTASGEGALPVNVNGITDRIRERATRLADAEVTLMKVFTAADPGAHVGWAEDYFDRHPHRAEAPDA